MNDETKLKIRFKARERRLEKIAKSLGRIPIKNLFEAFLVNGSLEVALNENLNTDLECIRHYSNLPF